MRVLICLLMALACLPVSLARAHATDNAWAVDYDRFYRVDLATRQASLIGPVGSDGPQAMADLSGLTTTPDGTVYAASDALKALIRIDPATGRGSLVGRFDIPQANSSDPLDFGMAASCDGSLWLSSPVTRDLWKVNPASGKAKRVGSMGRDIVGLAVVQDMLFGVGGRGEEGWYSIDTQSGRASLVGGLGSMITYITSASPVITDEGDVLAAFNYVPLPNGQTPPPWSDLVQIDLADGHAKVLGQITGPSGLRDIGIRGLTIGPPACTGSTAREPHASSGAAAVPDMGGWARLLLLLGIAGTGVAAARRRRSAPR